MTRLENKIIFEVTVLGNKLKTICEKLNINVSSAKNVLAIYKKEGRIEKKKYRVKRRKTGEESEITPQQSAGSSSTMASNDLPTKFNPVPQTSVAPAPSKFVSEVNINDMSLAMLFDSYCMCPQMSHLNTGMNFNQVPSMEDYFKTFNQMMTSYNKYFGMGMM